MHVNTVCKKGSPEMKTYSRVYAQIDLDNILHNMQQMRKHINKGAKIMGVIKTDAYGHGAVPIGRELERLEFVWGYATATAEEAEILRRNGLRKPVLVLGASFAEHYEALAKGGIRATVFSLRQAQQLEAYARETNQKIFVHIKIDTGMSRLGFQVTTQTADEIAQIAGMQHIVVEGMFTHFAKSDEKDKSMVREQLIKFWEMKELLEKRRLTVPILHCANSAAIIDMPDTSMDMVRAGISLYGMWPSAEVQKECIDLRPALSLKSTIVFVKDLEAGRTISYGATYQTERKQRIATIPVGYGDGYPRSLSSKGYVLIHGKRAPICGRICMDQFMVDVSHIPEAKEGDMVVLVGRDGEEAITMEEIGELSGRFNYEFACDLSKRIPRVYVKNHKITETKDYFGE